MVAQRACALNLKRRLAASYELAGLRRMSGYIS
jgi:hypothetical protein